MKTALKVLLAAALFIHSSPSLKAQGCLPEGIVFNSQEDVDNFESNYPGCTSIEGMVQIGGTVNDLAGLGVVEVFEGDVLVFGSELSDFVGLNEQVRIEGWLQVYECQTLANLDGLQPIDSLFGGLSIMECPSFTDLHGLENLVYTKTMELSINEALSDITALNSLQWVTYDMTFWDNNSLVSLSGLDNLQDVGQWLYFMHNDSLADLNALQNLTSVGSNFSLINNDLLTDIGGLNSELFIGGNLKIKDNENLSDCAATSICNYLSVPSGAITIENNAPGCNSPEEVEEACAGSAACLPEGIIFTTQGELDDFPYFYPECVDIEGFVYIETDTLSPEPIEDLTPLNQLVSIGGDLKITGNRYLKNLSGLESLGSIGGGLQVMYNDSLEGVQALAGLQVLGGGLHFQMNKSLLHLAGLDGLTAVNGDLVFTQHPILQNMDGLQNIEDVAGNFSVSWLCSMDNLMGFSGIKFIGGNMSVEHLCDVENLDAFDSLVAIGGELHINANDTLSDISGIGNIHVNSITGLEIMGNKNLSECHVKSVCGFMLEQAGPVSIVENLPGCNSPEEVEEACGSCLPDGIMFENQDDLSAFLLEYPDCNKIEGDVQIVGEGITDLSALSNITEIGGVLYIAQTLLENLHGLNQLVSVQGGLTLYQNNLLEQLTGLESLESIGGQFGIGFCPVYNFEGLEILTTAGGLSLYFTGTQDFTGLESLTNIDGGLSLDEMSDLQNLEGLQNVEVINGSLYIFSTGLSSLEGLENIDHNSIINMTITNNENLSSCDVESVCSYLADPVGVVVIHSNAPGCNSPEEVEEACLTKVEEPYADLQDMVLSPNPACSSVMIYSSSGMKVKRVRIADLSGHLLLDAHQPEPVLNISSFDRGIYLVSIHTEYGMVTRKLIVH